ncbi:MAG: SCO family protein [Hyphomicrobiales bacterium]|nr:MAG: SCO family protein [Hyphomicrobiales bacterium]
MARNPGTLLAAGGVGVLVLVLLGFLIAVFLQQPDRSAFRNSFSLIDDRGAAVDESLFTGHPSLVFFGYTSCPEACPTTMMEVTDWLNVLGPAGDGIKVYFFSIDPERDTAEVLHDYVEAFSDRIEGITGRPEEMRKAIEKWGISAERVPLPDGGYQMNHTVSLMMVGKDGRLKGMIPYGAPREAALDKIRTALLTPS